MNAEDRQLWSEHCKRIDDRHETLVTLITTEFERVNNHLSRLNGRTHEAEVNIIELRTRAKIRNAVFGVIGGAVASGLIMVIVKIITG